jgi:hypothetical protein
MEQGIYERRKPSIRASIGERFLGLYGLGKETGAILLTEEDGFYHHDNTGEIIERLINIPIGKLTPEKLSASGFISESDRLEFVGSDLSKVVLANGSKIKKRLTSQQTQ